MNVRTLLVAGFFLVPAIRAYAYLDPASGSMILQLILGGLAGLAMVVKLYWRRLLAFFGRKERDPDDE